LGTPSAADTRGAALIVGFTQRSPSGVPASSTRGRRAHYLDRHSRLVMAGIQEFHWHEIPAPHGPAERGEDIGGPSIKGSTT
ncbi:MAG: hypothetical protein NTY23_01435, partial [Chloroflexi bacterium]|nr:hypothetical protein [Chloroflexota bacterium]